MPAPLLHIESSADLPREADVVVIGGGVVGVFTAYYLARRGIRVALLEKGRVAAERFGGDWRPACAISAKSGSKSGVRNAAPARLRWSSS